MLPVVVPSGKVGCAVLTNLGGGVMLKRVILTALLAVGPSVSAQAAVIQVSGGELIGALGVNVAGTLYDVVFVEGSCVDLFSGCDHESDFTFTTGQSALLAAGALIDQVLIDTMQGQFRTDPLLTFGCEAVDELPDSCRIFTPVFFFEGSFVAVSVAPNPGLVAGTDVLGYALDSSNIGNVVFARWTRADTETAPEPGTLALFGLGAIGLAWRRRSTTKQ
jgi:hypothetical protein